MKITFLGATHEVTGSCTLIETQGKRFLVDCGLEQGKDVYENQPMPVSGSKIDYIFLTHAHIDHAGNIPTLYKEGFRGQIFMTEASAKLSNVMLKDSARIQEMEAEWRNRKAKRGSGEYFNPLYTTADAIGTISLFVPCPYEEEIQVCDGVSVRFSDVGHMLGSSSIFLRLNEGGEEKTILFSGDIGNENKPILKNPSPAKCADYVVMESTYGNRIHGEKPNYATEIAQIADEVFSKKGNLVIPSFAVGRTQELLFIFREIKERGLVKSYPDFSVYVDSPLANEATEVFNQCLFSCGDEETVELLNKGINPIDFKGLKTSISTEESKAINFDQTPKVIISASGMCEAGRIRHHLKHNLWRADSTVLFVGYQAVGTIGRTLLDGAKRVKLFGEEIEVRARILNLAGISGHADKNGLIEWLSAMDNKPQKVFVVHGEDKVCEEFAEHLNNLGYSAYAPFSGTEWDLVKDVSVNEGIAKLIVKGKIEKKKYSSRYAKLLEAGEKLMKLIRESEGYANRELEKRTNEINRIISRW